jgi:hypothetical protein
MSASAVAELLLDLGLAVRQHLARVRTTTDAASKIVARTDHDVIFAIDRHVEPELVERIARWPGEHLPVSLFAEGLSDVPLVIGGAAGGSVKWSLLIDPIDGTRGLMFEKRSGHFLAAAAPGDIDYPWLSDAMASVAVELPTAKAGWADAYVWSSHSPVRAERTNLFTGSTQLIHAVRPSTAVDLAQSFGSVVAFFSEGKRHAAELAERIAARTGAGGRYAQIFDDQYISTGGQIVELITGKDRFVIDVRPYLVPGGGQLCCHPYDLAIVPLARAAGVVLLSPSGDVLDAPFALDVDVAWTGYANADIARLVSPIVDAFVETLHGPAKPRISRPRS